MYGVPSHQKIKRQDKQLIGPDSNTNPNAVEILADGTIRAKKFVMSEGSELGVRCTDKKTPMFQRKISDQAVINYHVPNLKARYEVSYEESFSVKNCFAKIINKVKTFTYKKLGRYIHAPRVLRRAIDKLFKANKRYVATNLTYDIRHIKPYKRVTKLGPYNQNVRLKVTKDIDFITDLIVVKTGMHNNVLSDTIVWVSPHNLKGSSGEFHTSTGINLRGDTSIKTGQYLDAGLYSGTIFQVSSSNFTIKKDTFLKTMNRYLYYPEGGGQQEGEIYHSNEVLSDSAFYSLHREENDKINIDESWNGIVPEGAYFTIESWSTNDKYIGYDGEISVVPAEGDLDLTCEYTYKSKGVGVSYEDAYENAKKNCQKKFHRKLNDKLIELGYKDNPSKKKRYEKMIMKSAKGEYDQSINKLINNQVMIDSINEEEFTFHGTREDPKGGPQKKSTIDVPAQGGIASSTASAEDSTSTTSTTSTTDSTSSSSSDSSSGGNSGGYY